MAVEKNDMGLNLFWPVYIGKSINTKKGYPGPEVI